MRLNYSEFYEASEKERERKFSMVSEVGKISIEDAIHRGYILTIGLGSGVVRPSYFYFIYKFSSNVDLSFGSRKAPRLLFFRFWCGPTHRIKTSEVIVK